MKKEIEAILRRFVDEKTNTHIEHIDQKDLQILLDIYEKIEVDFKPILSGNDDELLRIINEVDTLQPAPAPVDRNTTKRSGRNVAKRKPKVSLSPRSTRNAGHTKSKS